MLQQNRNPAFSRDTAFKRGAGACRYKTIAPARAA